MNSHDENAPRFEALARALRAAEERERVFVPPTRDEAILKQARDHFAAGQPTAPRGWFSWRWILAGSVAVLAIAFGLIADHKKPQQFAREDINHDGQIDILDAMALAKLGGSASVACDQNGDGKIDKGDIEAIALVAVRLDPKPGI